jgi:hypothetical protein
MRCFYNSYEIVQHLFFDCALAKFIWRVIRHVFGGCVQSTNAKTRKLLFVGI